MKKITFTGIMLLTSILFYSCGSKSSEQEIKLANDQLYAALNSMFTGDLKPLDDLWLHESNITNMGPFGKCLVGWDEVSKEFK